MFDIGSSLREARLRQELDFPELEERTKIRPKYLRALEDERFDILPGAHVRAAASCARTPRRSASTGSRSSTSTTRASRSARTMRRCARAGFRRRDGTAGRASRGSRPSRSSRSRSRPRSSSPPGSSAGPESENVPGLAGAGSRGAHRRRRAKGTARLVVRASEGSSWMEVRADVVAPGSSSTAGRSSRVSGSRSRGRASSSRSRSRENVVVRLNGNRVELPEGHDVRRDLAEDRPGDLLSRPRAAIVVTGSRARPRRAAGPQRAVPRGRGRAPRPRAGVDRDRRRPRRGPRARVPRGLRAPISASSPGGLGPTHDDRTVELVARVAGRPLVVDEELERADRQRSRARSPSGSAGRTPTSRRACASRRRCPKAAMSLGLAGTAPGLVLDLGDCVVVVLPGPPRELQRLWPRALETDAGAPRARARPGRRASRAALLRHARVGRRARRSPTAGGEGDGVEVTICAREFEIHVDLFVEPGAEERGARDRRVAARRRSARYLFGEDERSVAEIVLDLCRARGLTLATAESCTGGMVAARLTAVPGASDVFRRLGRRVRERREGGGLGVPGELLAAHGAVSAEVAAAMAHGARERLGADVGGRGHRRRRAGWRHGGEARRARVRPCRRPGRGEGACAPSFPATAR